MATRKPSRKQPYRHNPGSSSTEHITPSRRKASGSHSRPLRILQTQSGSGTAGRIQVR